MDTTCRVARDIYIIPVYVFVLKSHRKARRCKKTNYKVNLDKIHIKIWEKGRCGGLGKKRQIGQD